MSKTIILYCIQTLIRISWILNTDSWIVK